MNTIPFIITHQPLPSSWTNTTYRNSSKHACSNNTVAWHKPFFLSFPTMKSKQRSLLRVLVLTKVRDHSLLQLLPLVHLIRALVQSEESMPQPR
ncbi:hypothetical protein QL285_068953 [Trifolium repens]|nr:hypothetical protein QL285_068953 [Trifolium repens]